MGHGPNAVHSRDSIKGREGFMCLAIPGQILDAQESGGGRMGRIQFGGIVRSVRLDFVPEAEVGDYVMVHVGFAISRVDGEEAKRTYRILKEMGALSEELPPQDWSV